MSSGSTQHATSAMNYLMHLQWLARSFMQIMATCPACGGNRHVGLTAVTLLLLAVALQPVIAKVVPNP